MAKGSEISQDILKNWVTESIKLDLVFDEEQDPPEEFKGLPCELKPLPKPKAVHTAWYAYFKQLKSIRIKVSLELDSAGMDYASKNTDKDKNLFDTRKSYINKLNSITWRCASAIDTLWQREKNGEVSPKVATLIALFHSELCASSTKDVSWGQAKSFTDTVPKNAMGYNIFQWIARHNVARSETHLGLSMDAIEAIVPLVDEFFDSGGNGVANLAKSITCKDDEDNNKDTQNILIRALYFQASRTLAQALGDMKRYTESRYYLKSSFAKAEEQQSEYWKEFFELLLFVECIDTKRINKIIGTNFKELIVEKSRPRIIREKKEALSRYPIELDGKNSTWKQLWTKNSINDSKWKESEEWLLRWHSAEPQQLGRHLRTIAENISSVFKNQCKVSQNNGLIGIIVSVFCIAHTTLERFDNQKEKPHVYWLLGKKKKDLKDVSRRNKNYIWVQGSVLYDSLREVIQNIDNNTEIADKNKKCVVNWKNRLKKFIESDEFKLVRSEADKVQMLQDKPNPKNGSGWCPLCKSIKCNNSCSVTKLLMTPLKNDKENIGSIIAKPNNGKKVTASREYYYNVMSGQQKRFLSYLQKRTGRDRIYEQGEIHRPAPCFEIICLRRWNSFSPNLGSRAAATIGGGYFVRAWAGDEKKGRYIGIVIDPGYNFLENFFNEGFTIADIDLVVLTHAHPDHIENFTNLLTLLRERDKRLKKNCISNPLISPKEHRILLGMTEGVFERIIVTLTAEEEFIRDIVVLSAKEFRGNKAGKYSLNLCLDRNHVCHMSLGEAELDCKKIVSLNAVRAWHNDNTGYDTIGLKIKHHNCKPECNDDNCENTKKDIADQKILVFRFTKTLT